jgi:hypothetical protein
MRKPSLPLAVALCCAISAGAEARAASLPFQGSLALQIGELDPIAVLGSGTADASGDGHLASLSFGPAVFAAADIAVPVTDPGAAPIASVLATIDSQAGAFAAGSGGFGGAMAITGVARVCLFVACGAGPPANVSVPLSVIGSGGSSSVTMLVNVTVAGAGWTAATAAVPTGFATLTVRGFAHGPASMTSSTAAPSGVVRLVTPIVISTNIASSAVVPAFGVLTLHFVPEPGTVALLGVGIAGLGSLGRARRR